MAQRVFQKWGQQYRSGTATQVWTFTGFADAAAVDARIQEFNDDEIQLEWGGLPISPDWNIQEVGGGVFDVTANYSAAAGNLIDPAGDGQYPQHGGEDGADQELPANISFATQGGTLKLTRGIATVQSIARDGKTPPNYGLSINVKDDGNVDGWDVLTNEPVWTLRVKMPGYLVTGQYVQDLEHLLCPIPHTNAADFFGYSEGEVLLYRATIGELSASGYRDAEFEFLVRRDQADVDLSGTHDLEFPDPVDGHNVVWAQLRRFKDEASGQMVTRPEYGYEVQVYPRGDFSKLSLTRFKKKV